MIGLSGSLRSQRRPPSQGRCAARTPKLAVGASTMFSTQRTVIPVLLHKLADDGQQVTNHDGDHREGLVGPFVQHKAPQVAQGEAGRQRFDQIGAAGDDEEIDELREERFGEVRRLFTGDQRPQIDQGFRRPEFVQQDRPAVAVARGAKRPCPGAFAKLSRPLDREITERGCGDDTPRVQGLGPHIHPDDTEVETLLSIRTFIHRPGGSFSLEPLTESGKLNGWFRVLVIPSQAGIQPHRGFPGPLLLQG